MTDIINKSFFRNPSFLKGAARTVALFGGLDTYKTSENNAKSDSEALKKDWQTVGQDILAASRTYGKSQSK